MDAILLVDHGSRVDAANAQLDAVAGLLRPRVHPTPVEVAHMELAPPSIDEGIRACVASGATRLLVVPYMLAPGRHAVKDIPRLVRTALESYPGVDAVVSGPLGVHPGLADVVLARIEECGVRPGGSDA